MIEIGFYNIYKEFNQNRMFTDMQLSLGDDLNYPSLYLYEYAKNRGINVSTIDTRPLDGYDAVVFYDFPGENNYYLKRLQDMQFKNLYLVVFENTVVRPENWNTRNYRFFKKVFRWSTFNCGIENAVGFYLPVKIPTNPAFSIGEKLKLCTLIASRKTSSHPLELYSERVSAIKWFERHHPTDFDLYGVGWPRLFWGYPSYRGTVASKNETLRKYRFSICYENAKDIPGYITEKIFDCLFAGCVPVYLGADNVGCVIPDNVFIDRRDFTSMQELYNFMKSMSDDTYQEYLDNITSYIKSDEIQKFSPENYAKTLLGTICGDMS